MDQKLKQRLTGAVILTALAIILLPVLLDGTQGDREAFVASIPEPPSIELRDITVQDVQQKMVQMERASTARMPREVVDESEYKDSPDFVLDQNNLPVNWSLQVGSFSSENNATNLRAALRKDNYRSYILYEKTGDGDIYRVFVGPSSSKDALNEINKAIEEKMNLQGRIVRYRIEDDKEQLGG